MMKNLWKFLNYWYFRYLLVTEIYMVEKWEEIMIYIVFFLVFTVLSLFNNFVVLACVAAYLNLHPLQAHSNKDTLDILVESGAV